MLLGHLDTVGGAAMAEPFAATSAAAACTAAAPTT